VWGTFLPSEAPAADGSAPRGVSILARDLQSVAFYDGSGTFVGVRRPDSGKPIQVGNLHSGWRFGWLFIGHSGIQDVPRRGAAYVMVLLSEGECPCRLKA